ncbi:MAG: cation/acetate symporter ActP [Betaproteobacteria bacterium]|jgi:cation/acetate symporter|nr:cation/acetate symporter ActP [Betaproteobacteria bacterium]MBK7081258.1 cation/acetate symporter ActP [Betaproteobacteria bacterium]MBK7744646.1 cation/acetate symporter ActP [Betaproteobacteria bacterium]MBK8687040.1 cation/acetate symporter ActP [Betaproteobacteria bacterium]MBK9677288.1 cation/acetate symporter ActP [Betaproteobacteria bacterium]
MNRRHLVSRRAGYFAGALALFAVATPALAQGAVADKWRWLTFLVFGAIISLTMFVTYLAAKRVKSAADFYTAGGGVSGLQNGWAIAGDYLSAASFLGIAGLISIWGYDGFMYSVGWLVAYITVLLVIAEPCRNIGKYTLSDILAYRNNPKATRIVGAISVITVSTFYLTAQMVGGGVLVKTLIGIDYEISVIAVGVLMLAYVLFGGMVATTWVQIIKAVLLVTASIVLVIMVWSQYGFFGDFLSNVIADPKVQARVAQILGDGSKGMSPAELGQRFLEPGLLFKAPIDQISLGMALVFGTAGLPHILMRFFTVPTAKAARVSVIWAMAIIGGFYVLTLFLGMGSAMKVGADQIRAVDAGGNMAAPLLAQALGGGADTLLGNFMLAFVAAVAFATIVAVVAGLVLAAASAMAHDLYVGVIREEHVTPAEQVRAARIATVIVGAMAITIGIAAKGQNVAHLVALAFAVAASANFPCVLLTLYWKRCNTGGIVLGMIVGTVTAIGLVLVSPNMTYPLAVKAAQEKIVTAEADKIAKATTELAAATDASAQDKLKAAIARSDKAKGAAEARIKEIGSERTSLMGLEKPLFELRNPGLISIPLGFLAVIVGSLLYRDKRAEDMWDELYARQNTGILASKAAAH